MVYYIYAAEIIDCQTGMQQTVYLFNVIVQYCITVAWV